MKKLTTFLSCIIILSGCTNAPEITEEKQNTLPQVKVMEVILDVEQDFTVNGEVTANKSAQITSEVRADVKSINVKPGDKVNKGQILLTLSSESIQKSFETASQSLNLSQNSLSQTQVSSSQNIQSAKTNLEKAQIAYNNLLDQNTKKREQALENLKTSKLNLNLSIDSAETSLETAEKNLEKTKELNASSESSSRTNLQNTIYSADTTIQSTITALDELLGVSTFYEQNNDTFESVLGALQSDTKITATNALRNLINEYDSIKSEYNSTYTILKIAEDATQKTLTMLNNSSTNSSFSQTTLDTYISTITTKLSSVRTSISSLSSAQTAYNQTLSANASSLNSAMQAIESAQNSLNSVKQETNGDSQVLINAQIQYDTTIAQLNASEDDAEKQLKSAQINYESSFSSSALSKNNASSGLTQASGSLEQAKINLEKLTIRAPFDGVILDVTVQTGDEVNVGTLLTQIENNQILKIIAYLNSSQVQKVKAGDTVNFATQSQDKISAISASIDPVLKKYKVEILHQNPYLHSGQIIPIRFSINQNSEIKTQTIHIPLVALHINSSESFVWTIDSENKTKKTIVETNEIVGNQIEITSGLKSGDIVITDGGRLFQKEGTEVEIIE